MVTRSLCIDMSKEKQVGEALEIYAQQHAMGRWAMAIYGVAGIISAGLLAHIDMDLAKTPGHIFAYAGMAPGVKWIGSEKSKAILKAEGIAPKSDIKLSTEQAMTALAKGSELSGVKLDNLVSRAEVQDKERNNLGYYTGSSLYKSLSRRPWNAEFKVLCWKIGQSFIKTQNKEKDVYGHIFAKRKAEEMLKNKNGAYKKQAEAILKASPGHKQGDEFYSKGMLPDSHIMSRAARYATKIFLSHWWEVAYEVHNGVKPPFQPYPLDILGHAHKIEPPKSLTDLDDEDGVAV